MQQQWSAVDNYMISSLLPDDEVLSQVLENNKRAGLPEHDVAANQGQLLALFVRMTRQDAVLRSVRWAPIAQSGWRAPCRRTES